MLPAILSKLVKVDGSRLGALDGTKKVLGCFDGPEPLSKVLRGEVAKWQWRSVSEREITNPTYYAVTLFIKHSLISAQKTLRKFIHAQEAVNKVDIDASIIAVMIGKTVFLKDSYLTADLSFDIETDDANAFNIHGNIIKGVFCGIFDLNTCSYYHTFSID